MVCTVISSDDDNGEDPTPERVTHYGCDPNTKRSEEKKWAHFLAFLPLSPAVCTPSDAGLLPSFPETGASRFCHGWMSSGSLGTLQVVGTRLRQQRQISQQTEQLSSSQPLLVSQPNRRPSSQQVGHNPFGKPLSPKIFTVRFIPVAKL